MWHRLLGAPENERSRELTRIFSSFLDVDEMLMKRNFTTLHKIILKLSSVPLQSQLSISTADIDAQCSYGTSPLETAIQLGELNSVRTLLEFGASFRKSDVWCHTPIHHAADSSSAQCLHILLSVASKMEDDKSPRNLSDTLSPGVSTSGQLSFAIHPWMKDLLSQRCLKGSTALQLACYGDETGECVRLLLDYSADVNSANPLDMSTPLSATLQKNNHAALRHIIQRAPNQDFIDKDGMGMLHYLAYFGDKRTFGILLQSGIVRITANNDKDNFNHTPLEGFDVERTLYVKEDDATRSWCRQALLQLMNWRDNNPFPDVFYAPSHDVATKYPPTSPIDSDEDVFYDFDHPLG